nr:MAG TPA: hypothetical protein [Caudoviricetes sp.]
MSARNGTMSQLLRNPRWLALLFYRSCREA